MTMGRPSDHTGDDLSRAFVEELLRTSFALQGVVASLLEQLPEDAFPGEDNGEVLLEMVAGTCRPTIEAAGAPVVRGTLALIGAVVDSVVHDLREAAARSRRSGR
jgi:hypothetical protein